MCTGKKQFSSRPLGQGKTNSFWRKKTYRMSGWRRPDENEDKGWTGIGMSYSQDGSKNKTQNHQPGKDPAKCTEHKHGEKSARRGLMCFEIGRPRAYPGQSAQHQNCKTGRRFWNSLVALQECWASQPAPHTHTQHLCTSLWLQLPCDSWICPCITTLQFSSVQKL